MCQSAPTSPALQQSSALQQMWACALGTKWVRETGDVERQRARCSWRIRLVFQRQARICPKAVIRPKNFSQTVFLCATKEAQAAKGSGQLIYGNKYSKLNPTSVVWHSFAQSLFSPSQIWRTSPPAPGRTVCASRLCHTDPGEARKNDKVFFF